MRFLLASLALVGALSGQKLEELCAACHSEPASDFRSHPHAAKGLSCDACHGPSKAHREATGHKPPDRVAGPAEQAAVCGACHALQSKEYGTSKHGRLVAARTASRAASCTTCHGTHAIRNTAAMIQQCNRCHAALPESCKKNPPAAAALRCAGCHGKHTVALAR